MSNLSNNQGRAYEFACLNALYEAMEDEVGYTATQISNMGVDGIASASKATTILRILLEDGRATNKKVKGVSTYYKA